MQYKTKMTMVHAVWRGLIVSVSILQGFLRTSRRDVEQTVPRFCIYILRYRYDKCRALPVRDSLRGDDDRLDVDGRLSAGVET